MSERFPDGEGKIGTVPEAVMEHLQSWSPALEPVLPVSDSVGGEVRSRARRGVPIEILPNSYDDARFNPTVREEKRKPIREKRSLRPFDVVFIFTSLGQ